MLIGYREFLLKKMYYLSAIRRCFNAHGIIVRIVGVNSISVRRQNDILIEIFRGNRDFRYFRMLIPRIRGNVRFFKMRENGDIHFKI
jgi:hypothetical protein